MKNYKLEFIVDDWRGHYSAVTKVNSIEIDRNTVTSRIRFSLGKNILELKI